jgi:hypothetical protein
MRILVATETISLNGCSGTYCDAGTLMAYGLFLIGSDDQTDTAGISEFPRGWQDIPFRLWNIGFLGQAVFYLHTGQGETFPLSPATKQLLH